MKSRKKVAVTSVVYLARPLARSAWRNGGKRKQRRQNALSHLEPFLPYNSPFLSVCFSLSPQYMMVRFTGDYCVLTAAPVLVVLVFGFWLARWVKPSGNIFFRESCHRQSGDRKRLTSNPTQYRDPKVREAWKSRLLNRCDTLYLLCTINNEFYPGFYNG